MLQIPISRKLLARMFAAVLVLAVSGLSMTSSVAALSLDEAKAQGLIGERPNGYLGVVPGAANGQAAALVNQINAKRRAAYQSVADSNGTTLKSVEVLAGRKLIGRLKSGQWFIEQGGGWKRR
jgi:uncharacterized protein